jgi:multidrug efflux system outer membrane protein
MKRFLKCGVPLVACLLSACDFAPTYVPPPVATPTDFKESADWTPATPRDSAPRGPWWQIFQDPALDRLEDQVTAANQNLKIAVAQYDEARADASTAQADYYPTLDAGGSASRQGLSREAANPLPNRSFKNYSLGLDFDYEIEAKAGADREQASAGDLATVDLSLHAELASDYFILRGDDAEQDVLDRTVENYRKALELTQARFNIGYAAKPDVSAAEAQFESATTQATEIRLKRTNLEHAIAILTGQPPAGFALPANKLDATPPDIAPVLRRRPARAASRHRGGGTPGRGRQCGHWRCQGRLLPGLQPERAARCRGSHAEPPLHGTCGGVVAGPFRRRESVRRRQASCAQ